MAQKQQRPNILIFMTDQEQADVTAPGHPCRTPNADRFAAEGLRFTRTFCPTAHCCPSRATFVTGLYPSRHGVFNNVSTPTAIHFGLNEGVRTFGEGLQEAGYNLAWAGKWHVTNEENPSDRGWRELFVTARAGSVMHPTAERWREVAAEQAKSEGKPRRAGQVKRPGWGDYQLFNSYPDKGPKGYEGTADDKVVQSAAAALPELAKGNAPWCLYVGVLGPHDPFVVPERFLRMYDDVDVPLPPSFRDDLSDKPRVYRRMRHQYWDQLTEDEVRESIRHYWAYCTMVDALFGEVLDALEKTGQAENTLVLRLSDHGEYAAAHGLYCKGVPAFREAYHIPFIARWPKGINGKERTVDSFVSLADFAPTFLEMAGAKVPDDLSGRSLTPFFRGETPADWPDEIHTQFNGVELYYTQRSVTTRDYKYVYNGFDFDELYDLKADPHEMTNLAEDPAHSKAKREMVRRMWRFAARENDMVFNPYATVALAPFGPADALGGVDNGNG